MEVDKGVLYIDNSSLYIHTVDPQLFDHSDYLTYPLHWYSIIQNSIVVCGLYFAVHLHVLTLNSYILQLTYALPHVCMS
jgi:hypothetical protein